MRICFATNNIHKFNEVQHLLGERFQLVTLQKLGCNNELPEEQETLEGNSFQKAEFIFQKYNTSCFADDSGLEVEALNGAPGVNSAHYGGPQRSHEDNIDLLLKNMTGVSNRSAQFRTVITFIAPGHTRQFEGTVKGTIHNKKKGTAGFGYDPIFEPAGYSRTFAEMSLEEKNKFSHRAIAVKKLVEFLKTINPS